MERGHCIIDEGWKRMVGVERCDRPVDQHQLNEAVHLSHVPHALFVYVFHLVAYAYVVVCNQSQAHEVAR